MKILITILKMIFLIKASTSIFLSPVNLLSGTPILPPINYRDYSQHRLRYPDRYQQPQSAVETPNDENSHLLEAKFLTKTFQSPQFSMSSPLSTPMRTSKTFPMSRYSASKIPKTPKVSKVRRPGRYTRRLDCSIFCQTTGFHGVIGGCNCGYTLFKRGEEKTFSAASSDDQEKSKRGDERSRRMDEAPDYGWDADEKVTTPEDRKTDEVVEGTLTVDADDDVIMTN